jgi:predicted DsbA family dithiol-disulfide isomerase
MSAAEPPRIPIDLIGDVASAECFIGLHLIDAVVASAPGLAVDIRWHPFQIDPDLPPEGQDRAAYLEDKFGSAQEAREALASLAETAREFELAFAFDKIRRQPNTLEAHRVVRFARNFNVGIKMVEALFGAFFLDGQDIGDRGVLVALAARSGLDPRLVADFLAGADDIEALNQELTGFRALGVEDVPRFIIAGKKTITGIIPAEDFADALFSAIEDE